MSEPYVGAMADYEYDEAAEAAQLAEWRRAVAAGAAAWSASAKAAEVAAGRTWIPLDGLRRIAPDFLSAAEEDDARAAKAKALEGLAALRRITDAAAWRAAQEAAGAASEEADHA